MTWFICNDEDGTQALGSSHSATELRTSLPLLATSLNFTLLGKGKEKNENAKVKIIKLSLLLKIVTHRAI